MIKESWWQPYWAISCTLLESPLPFSFTFTIVMGHFRLPTYIIIHIIAQSFSGCCVLLSVISALSYSLMDLLVNVFHTCDTTSRKKSASYSAWKSHPKWLIFHHCAASNVYPILFKTDHLILKSINLQVCSRDNLSRWSVDFTTWWMDSTLPE